MEIKIDINEKLLNEISEMRKESYKKGIMNERERITKVIIELRNKQIAINSREEQVIDLVKEELMKYMK